jgi:V8-like Glu-specific endopeptidase
MARFLTTFGAFGLSASPVEALDYKNAEPFQLPAANYSSETFAADVIKAYSQPPELDYVSDLTPGNRGSGKRLPQRVEVGKPKAPPPGGATPMEFGKSGLPFTTARADLEPASTNEQYPYRAVGKLFFLKEDRTYMCTASLVKRGIVVTASHCVSKFGSGKYYSGWQFVPGFKDGQAPFGKWDVQEAQALQVYLKGDDKCAQTGVVCSSDVAVLVIKPQVIRGHQVYAGDLTGWFAVGWNKSGFTPNSIAHVTQIGYPSCLDGGLSMERNDAQGVISKLSADNTVIGSLMCEGSSGGPWIVNFGIRPSLTGTLSGISPEPNQIIGVSSWGSTDQIIKQMGASPFLSTNIKPLLDWACGKYPDACKPSSK